MDHCQYQEITLFSGSGVSQKLCYTEFCPHFLDNVLTTRAVVFDLQRLPRGRELYRFEITRLDKK